MMGFPKEMVFIGTSDQSNEIAYVYYLDYDLDYIEESLQEFLKNECGWEN